MHDSVRTFFRKFNEPFEGVVHHMYLDIKGLVTVGVGNLIDPVSHAVALPFQWKTKPGIKTPGARATPQDIRAEWSRLKADTSLARKGHRACTAITNLELTTAAIDALIAQKLNAMEASLKKNRVYKDFDTWPADAQLALLSMSWAMGPGGPPKFVTMSNACAKLDFDTASKNCKINETGNPGLIPRNQANKKLYQNAAAVMACEKEGFTDFPRERLHYPGIVMKPVIIQ